MKITIEGAAHSEVEERTYQEDGDTNVSNRPIWYVFKFSLTSSM